MTAPCAGIECMTETVEGGGVEEKAYHNQFEPFTPKVVAWSLICDCLTPHVFNQRSN